MSLGLVQVAVAGDVAEAEEMQAILRAAGIEAELQAAQDDALTVLVPEDELVSAREALEALTEPDDLIAEP
jgi:type III secretory pathway lipoprotein EscJ